jgi:hypothetical protein
MATEDTIPQNDLDPDCAFCKAFEESSARLLKSPE